MRVGEIAERTGVSVRAIRHYERAGLLAARRGPNGYRSFDASAVSRVRAIRDLLAVGFTLAEIGSLSACLGVEGGGSECCVQTAALYRDRLARIDAQLATLAAVRERIVDRIAALEPCAAPVRTGT